MDVFNFCFSVGFLTRSQHRGVISLTFKKGDRLDQAIGGLYPC